MQFMSVRKKHVRTHRRKMMVMKLQLPLKPSEEVPEVGKSEGEGGRREGAAVLVVGMVVVVVGMVVAALGEGNGQLYMKYPL